MLNVKKGEIYYAELDPTKGAEMGGRRPVLIISNNKGNEHGKVVAHSPAQNFISLSTAASHKANLKTSVPTSSLAKHNVREKEK